MAEAMAFRLKGRPAKLLRLLPAYAMLGATLRGVGARMRRRQRQLTLAWLVVTALGAATASSTQRIDPGTFVSLAALGPIFCGYAGAFLRLFRNPVVHPQLRAAASGRGAIIFLTLFLSVWGAVVAVVVTSAGFGIPAHPPAFRDQWLGILAGLSSATLFVGLMTLRARAKRLANITVVEAELDWIQALAKGLLKDAPPDTRVAMTFNPFPAFWSEKRIANARKRAGYTYPASVDRPLTLEADFGAGLSFALTTQLTHVTKIKNRKGKYKGTKYRMRQVMRFEHPRFAELLDASYVKEAMADALSGLSSSRSGHASKDGVKWVGPLAPGFDIVAKLQGNRVVLRCDFKHSDSKRGETLIYIDPDVTIALAKMLGKRLVCTLDAAALAPTKAPRAANG